MRRRTRVANNATTILEEMLAMKTRFNRRGLRKSGALGRLDGARRALGWLALTAVVMAPPNTVLGDAADAANPRESAEENPHLWQTRTTSVAVFKNGMGFFMREGDVALREGWCLAKQIPPATFGTLGIYSIDPDELVDVVGSGPGEVVEFDGVHLPDDLDTRRARLEASRHLNVQLGYKQHGGSRLAAGKLVSVGPDFAVLESDNHSFAVPIEAIERLQILDLPLRVHVASARENDQPQPAGAPDEPAETRRRTRLGMAYLRQGITWIPEYTLRVLDENRAELTLRGTLVNEAEDLVHCDVHLVVGVPHFLHADYMAPLAVGQVIRTIGSAVAPPGLQSQIMQRAAIASNAFRSDQFEAGGVVDQPVQPANGNVAAVLGNLPQMEGHAATDYTVYTKNDLTLRQGEKAIITLFRQTITYSHIYRWNPPEAMQHSLVLHNDTDTAWTTGPCLAVSEQRPLSEDLLKYTPKAGRAELPVTAAINISHHRSEAEIDRRLKAHSPAADVHLDLVTLEGTLKLHNFETRDTQIVISADVPGKPLSASDDGETSIDSTKLQLLQRAGSIRWRLALEPGEKKTLTYRYERYVPSR
jgi:hypothetical protein